MQGMLLIEWFDACAAGIYLLFGGIHLDLWWRRRERGSHLWLATAAGGALLVDVTGMILRPHGTEVIGILATLNLLGVATVTASLVELVRSLSGDHVTRAARLLYAAFAVLAVCTGAGWPSLTPYFMSISGTLLLTAMVRALRAGRAGDRESRAIATGLIVLVLCLVADILMDMGVLSPKLYGLPIVGFATLFVVSARALNARYDREHRELAELRDDLEQRVRERTRALEEANRMLAEVSRTDALTGLLNRRAFLEECERELHRAARAGQTCSVVMVDLDHFKQVNDRHGHAGGDALLRAAATCLRAVLRGEDLVARWGGEEFILLLPNTDGQRAVVVAEKARTALATTSFSAGGTTESITGSFGIAPHRADRPFEATIAAADDALYRAKEGGRNRVVTE